MVEIVLVRFQETRLLLASSFASDGTVRSVTDLAQI
jgi:hypothetical protein